MIEPTGWLARIKEDEGEGFRGDQFYSCVYEDNRHGKLIHVVEKSAYDKLKLEFDKLQELVEHHNNTIYELRLTISKLDRR